LILKRAFVSKETGKVKDLTERRLFCLSRYLVNIEESKFSKKGVKMTGRYLLASEANYKTIRRIDCDLTWGAYEITTSSSSECESRARHEDM